MKKIDHELLLSKIQDAERKYKSVAKAPPDVLADIQAMTNSYDVTDDRVELTRYEVKIIKRRIDGEISEAFAIQLLGRSNSWLRRRISQIKANNYQVLEDETDDETTKTHEEVSTQEEGPEDATTRP